LGAGGAGGEGSRDLGLILESNGLEIGRLRFDFVTAGPATANGLHRSSEEAALELALSLEKLTRILYGADTGGGTEGRARAIAREGEMSLTLCAELDFDLIFMFMF
jgi:hypothetical protein